MPATPLPITISYGGSSFTYPNLAEHPLTFDATDAQRGQVAEGLSASGLLLADQADSLLVLWRAWNSARLPEDAPELTGTVGSTVAVSGRGPGFDWSTPRACWFSDAPSITQVGIFSRVSVSVVDATQALAVILRQQEEQAEQTNPLNLGTLALGGATINLTARPDTFDGLPQLQLNPAAAHVISGPLALQELREVEGWVTAAHLTLLETWVKTTIATTPAANSWFPTSWTRPTAVMRANGGALALTYDVGLTLVKVRG